MYFKHNLLLVKLASSSKFAKICQNLYPLHDYNNKIYV